MVALENMTIPDTATAAINFLPSFMEIGLGGLIVWAVKKWGIRESYVMMAIGALGVFVCVVMIWISGKIITLSTLIQVVLGTATLCAWSLIILKARKETQGRVLASPSQEDASRLLNPKEHEDEITRAVHGRLQKSEYFSFARSAIGSAGFFLEYSQHDPSVTYLSDTFAIREVSDPIVTPEIGRHIRSVSRLVAGKEMIFRNVIVVLLVYRSLSLPERASLTQQFEELRKSAGISEKIHFESWDKNDLDRYGSM